MGEILGVAAVLIVCVLLTWYVPGWPPIDEKPRRDVCPHCGRRRDKGER